MALLAVLIGFAVVSLGFVGVRLLVSLGLVFALVLESTAFATVVVFFLLLLLGFLLLGEVEVGVFGRVCLGQFFSLDGLHC